MTANKKEFTLQGVKRYRLLPSVRLLMTLLVFMGCIVLSSSFFAVTFTINCMVSSSDSLANKDSLPIDNKTALCKAKHHVTSQGYNGHFNWSATAQSNVLAGTGYGGSIFLFLGGILGDVVGARIIYPIGLLIFAITNALIPTAVNYGGWQALLGLRIVQGICQIIGWPMILVVCTQWFPIPDRGMLLGLATSGTQVGGLIVNGLGGVFCSNESIGWEKLFYLIAAFCIVTMICWIIFYTDDIESSYWLSPRELTYILRTRGQGRKKEGKQRTPWLHLLTSPAVLSILAVNFLGFYMAYFMGDYVPRFYKDVLFISVSDSGIYNAVQMVVQMVGRIVGGPLSDYIQRRWSATTSVKVLTGLSIVIPAGCLLAVAFADCTRTKGAIVGIMVAYFFFGLTVGGFLKAGSLVAPPFSGTIGGMAQTFSNLAIIVVPLITGKILGDNPGEKEWRIGFIVASVSAIVGGVIFMIWGSGEAQPWSRIHAAKIRPSVMFTGFDYEAVGFRKSLPVVGDDRRYSAIPL